MLIILALVFHKQNNQDIVVRLGFLDMIYKT